MIKQDEKKDTKYFIFLCSVIEQLLMLEHKSFAKQNNCSVHVYFCKQICSTDAENEGKDKKDMDFYNFYEMNKRQSRDSMIVCVVK